jgi:hypothetical protein
MVRCSNFKKHCQKGRRHTGPTGAVPATEPVTQLSELLCPAHLCRSNNNNAAKTGRGGGGGSLTPRKLAF